MRWLIAGMALIIFVLFAGCDSNQDKTATVERNVDENCADFTRINPLSIIGTPPLEAPDEPSIELIFLDLYKEGRRKEVGVALSGDPKSSVASDVGFTENQEQLAISSSENVEGRDWVRFVKDGVWPQYVYTGNKIPESWHLICAARSDPPDEVRLDGSCNLRGFEGSVYFDMHINGDIWIEYQDQALSKLNRLLKCKSGAGEHKDRL